jgi:DNA-binding beta-propeller fold protein YncE
MKQFVLLCLVAVTLSRADEFSDLTASFGTTSTMAGMLQAETNNPDGTAINFWQPSFEGALFSTIALSNPHMVGADAYGNTYVADKSSHSVLKITPDGRVHTFAGTHVRGFNGDGPAPATSLQLNDTNGLFVFPDGLVYLLDPGNHRIRRVTPDGIMTTVVNDPDPEWFPSGRGLWVSPDEQLIYYSNELAPVPPALLTDSAVLKKWTPAGGIEILCSKETGFNAPGNMAVNPVDGKLYVTDRAENDTTKLATGLFRIDGPNQRTRVLGNSANPVAADGQMAANSFVDQCRGIAFLPNGAYFTCGHKDGSIWYVDTGGIMHRYLLGAGKKDTYSLPGGEHPPLLATTYFCQPRCVIIAPNGDLLVVSNDSGFVFKVNNAATPHLPETVNIVNGSGGAPTLRWQGLFGRGYRVERSTTLDIDGWQSVGAAGGLAAGQLTEFTDPGAAALSRAFYRLKPSL